MEFSVMMGILMEGFALTAEIFLITLVKDTSLAFVLGIMEMFSAAKALAASEVSMVPYAIAALIYWVFCLLIEFILNRVEKRLDYYHD